ncbi:MAG: DUF1549 domain-containing protein, partial [Verrucomicrobiota bacterium]
MKRLLILIFFSSGLLKAEEAKLDFNRDIRPILSDKCFFCHGPDSHERKADLRLDTAEGALEDLGGYAAIVPGDPEDSEFMIRVWDDEDPMPPEKSHKTMTQKEIDLLERWIREGAEYSEPWAYVDPQPRTTPEVKRTDWPANWIDHFILSRLEKEGLDPSPDADKITLLRRLHFDLTGLPPTPAEVAAFQSGELSLAQVVDRLLESPHFGERLAMYWLDLVRYADTVGYHGDQPHNISPYRDWVIAALNANMPFDQFTREQLAGDLLPEATLSQKVASGYNRLLQTTHEGGLQIKEYDAIYAADRVRNVSAVWMGATIGCAQCHDHKYDPYTIKDHYAMAAFFSDIADRGFSGNTTPTQRPPEIRIYSQEQQAELDHLNKTYDALLSAEDQQTLNKLDAEKKKLSASLKKAKAADQPKIQTKLDATQVALAKIGTPEELIKYRQVRDRLYRSRSAGQLTMITVAQTPRPTRILARGDWQDETGDLVLPAVPEFMGKIDLNGRDSANRLDLANW